MKHTLQVTMVLLLIFLVTQLVGLFTVSSYVDIKATAQTGSTVIHQNKYLISPPEMVEDVSWVYISLAMIIGTGLALLIVKFNKVLLWKIWLVVGISKKLHAC